MGSLTDELQRREAAARQEAEELRGRIAQLGGRLGQVEQAVVSAAADIAAFYAARVLVPRTAPTLLVISADAKGIVMRPGALRPATARAASRQGKMRTRLTAGEKPNRKRMATLARWGLDGAEAILILRAVISNGDFDEYWQFHLASEHQRLYPGTAQGQYTLGA